MNCTIQIEGSKLTNARNAKVGDTVGVFVDGGIPHTIASVEPCTVEGKTDRLQINLEGSAAFLTLKPGQLLWLKRA
jgi:hypothetical protein